MLQYDVDSMLGKKHEWVVGGVRGYLAPSCHEGVFVDGLGWAICVRSGGSWQITAETRLRPRLVGMWWCSGVQWFIPANARMLPGSSLFGGDCR